RTRIKVHAHVLDGTGRGIEQGEVIDVLRIFLGVGLADADAEVRRRILPVPDVSEIGVNFAGEEERVRRREGSERCTLAFRDNPGKVTWSAAPSVFTVQPEAWNDALACLMSDSLRGGPMISRPGFSTSGASQNAYQRFLSMTSGVSSTPAALSGSACCVDMRRMPLTKWYSGVRFCPSVTQGP